MGYKLQKRLDLLKDQTNADREGRIGLFKALLGSFFLFWIFAHFFNQAYEPLPAKSLPTAEWGIQTQQDIEARGAWLESSWVGSAGARWYRRFAKNFYEAFVIEPLALKEGEEVPSAFFDIDGWFIGMSHGFTGFFLRLVFVIVASWPLWIIGLISGVGFFRLFLLPKRTDDLLGVLSRGAGPFYSGIFGPLISNNSQSGTDLSAPNLACPERVKRQQAMIHTLVNILKEFGALNETNTELVRVILAYRDFPGVVDDERLIEEEGEAPHEQVPSSTRTNEEGTLEKVSLEGLSAVLSAHHVLVEYFRSHDAQSAPSEEQFGAFAAAIAHSASRLKPLAKELLLSLTPSRGKALASVPPQAVASAYLAIEAGKSLVYRREGKLYVQISRFPHLQARAVLQSIVAYHHEYRGDMRMVMRQAILCARRHGDFGRTFLPVNMPINSRALRDWLEILYAAPKRRHDVAHLVELDTHIEEISVNWRKEFARRLEKSQAVESPALRDHLWKGISFKSVVLVPLRDLVPMAMSTLHRVRLDRISELLKLTRKLQASLSISARLPGFKRQATEAEKSALDSGGVTKLLAENESDAGLLEGWLILRRLLTKYNWLSTRVGDDAVPEDGLVQAIVADTTSSKAMAAIELDALVPLRQRRFRELLGPQWESAYYAHSPHEDDVDIFVDNEEFRKELTERKAHAVKTLLSGTPPTAAENT